MNRECHVKENSETNKKKLSDVLAGSVAKHVIIDLNIELTESHWHS